MSEPRRFFVYILASGKHGTLYIGMTNDLMRRIYAHQLGAIEGFTKKYNVIRLVYFEELADAASALHRERRLKKYNRDWKINLIEACNPAWVDFSETLGPL